VARTGAKGFGCLNVGQNGAKVATVGQRLKGGDVMPQALATNGKGFRIPEWRFTGAHLNSKVKEEGAG